MARWVSPYPKHAIHDLAHLDSLSDVPSCLLLVSPRTLYVIQNLVDSEVTWHTRYAVSLGDGGFSQVQEGDDDYPLFQSVVEEVENEVYDVGSPLWENWTPVVRQGGEDCTTSLTTAKYLKVFDLATVYCQTTISAASGETGMITIHGFPESIYPSTVGIAVGVVIVNDTGVRYYIGNALTDVDESEAPFFYIISPQGSLLGIDPAFTLGNGDVLEFTVSWEI